MVVSFPPADSSGEPAEALAPVTSLFGRRAEPAVSREADGWFTGTPESDTVDGPDATDRVVAPVRRLPTRAPRVEPAAEEPAAEEPAAPPVRQGVATPPVARAPEPARIAWTTAPVAPDVRHDRADEDLAEDDDVREEPVDPEVRLAELDLLAVRRLARRGCSEWEIAELLRGHDAEPHEVEHVLDELRRRGYLDDAELARQLVESLHTRKGQSRAVIGRELAARRIEQSVAAEALEAIDDDDELRRALVVAEKRAGQLSSLDRPTAERRLSAYLARRGYGSAVVREACSRALAGSKRPGVTFR